MIIAIRQNNTFAIGNVHVTEMVKRLALTSSCMIRLSKASVPTERTTQRLATSDQLLCLGAIH
jgi:hypothetical protein